MHILQQKILNIAQGMDVSGLSLRKLGVLIQESHPQKIKHHLLNLEKNGYVKLDSEKNRIVEVLKKDNISKDVSLWNIPILGSANAGSATLLAEQDHQGYLMISPAAMGSRKKADGLFAIQVVGESLNRARDLHGGVVNNGDYVIVDATVTTPQNGNYVLSVIGGSANVKRFYKDEQHNEIRLVSESTLNIPPIVLHDDDLENSNYVVNGKLLRVVKNI